jgi:hypothetical protein
MDKAQPDGKPSGVPGMTVLRGGEDFEATLIDGKKHVVFIRLIPIAEMKKYLSLYDEFAEMVAFATGEEIKSLKSLTEDSLYALYKRITEINDPRLDRWLRERAAAVAKFNALQTTTAS